MRIADIMTRQPVTIGPDASLAEAAELMAAHRVGGLPVLVDGHLVGMVTEEDVVRRLHSESGASQPAHTATGRWPLAHVAAVLGRASVGDVMAADTVAVSPSTPVERVADLMMRHAVTRVPVVAWGSVVGIATQLDVVAAVVGRRRPAPPAEVRMGWRFLDPRHRLPEARRVRAQPGLRIRSDPEAAPFEEVPAAYSDILDALANGRGLTVCRVRLSGLFASHGGREVATDWECLWLTEAGIALVGWAADAVDRALQLQQAAGHAADPRVREVLRLLAHAADGDADEPEVSREIRAVRAARRADLPLAGVSRALDAVLEAAQAAQAALAARAVRDATAAEVAAWETIAVAAIWDAAREAVRALDGEETALMRQRLEDAVLGAAPLLLNLG